MTHNQIEYWKYKELNRHNLVTEGIDTGKLNESVRHNKVTEGIDIGKLNESVRHNKVTESQTDFQMRETQRHNLATEGLTGRDLNIQAGYLAETHRHNLAAEDVSYRQVATLENLNASQANLNDVRATWEAISGEVKKQLTQAQITEIDNRLEKYDAEIDKMRQETTRTGQDIQWRDYEELLKGVDSVSKFINGLIPW